MVVLQVQKVDMAVIVCEGDAPVPGDRNAPVELPFTGQSMNPPTSRSLGNELVHVIRDDKQSENVTYTAYEIGVKQSWVVILDEQAKTPMPDR